MAAETSPFLPPSTAAKVDVAELVWRVKYQARSAAGEPLETTMDATFERVARAISAAEDQPERWRELFAAAMRARRLMPGGRVLAGAGAAGERTLLNTFVMARVDDDLERTLENLHVSAHSMRCGGGIGLDFSHVSPRGGGAADEAGPLAFMGLWDSMCRSIVSSRTQRGAMMAVLACDHPDVAAFVSAKGRANELSTFNVSVLISDAFMHAVEAAASWELRFGGRVVSVVPARALWDQIVRSSFDSGEPGVIFIDRLNRQNNLAYCEDIVATNSCGEQPLPEHGAAPLASINLAVLVRDPFTTSARIEPEELAELATLGVRMLDDILTVTSFPDPRQRAEAHAKRRIGLGVTGLGDALIQCGARYGSQIAAYRVRSWLETIQSASYRASCELARERGPFPAFRAEPYLAAPTVSRLPPDVRDAIARRGMRNAVVNSIAPAGSISLLADNVSSGIEPVFSHICRRDVSIAAGEKVELVLRSFSLRRFQSLFGRDAPLPDSFVTAQDIAPEEHVAMLAAAQPFVDASISKTVNCPADMSFERFRAVYSEAFASGCKSLAAYRPNGIRGSVLRPDEGEARAPKSSFRGGA
jgi:ribonucleoside-diphosphate reductase alpha chain